MNFPCIQKLSAALSICLVLTGCSFATWYHDRTSVKFSNSLERKEDTVVYPSKLNENQIREITKDLSKNGATCFTSNIPNDINKGNTVCAFIFCWGSNTVRGYSWRFDTQPHDKPSSRREYASFRAKGWSRNACKSKSNLLTAQHIFARKQFHKTPKQNAKATN
jgi:hypothetical protein